VLSTDLDFNFPAFTTHPLSTSTTFGSLSDDQRERYVAAFHRKIHEEVASFKPDIAHAHHGWVIGAALADLGAPYVISLHGTEHYGFTHYPAYRKLVLKGLRQADRVLALTEVERAKAIETYNLDPERVLVITSGVDTHSQTDSSETRLNVCSHALSSHKGSADTRAAAVVVPSSRRKQTHRHQRHRCVLRAAAIIRSRNVP
jgi:glycosyltransferase involved in cell wall biosynthesis